MKPTDRNKKSKECIFMGYCEILKDRGSLIQANLDYNNKHCVSYLHQNLMQSFSMMKLRNTATHEIEKNNTLFEIQEFLWL
jgi:hypothetical protein